MWTVVKQKANGLWRDEEGLGMLEIILIIAVIIIIAAIFRDQLKSMVTALLKSVSTKADDFMKEK